MEYLKLTPQINKKTHPHLKQVTKSWHTFDGKYYILYDEPNGYKHLRIIRVDGQPIHNFGEDIIAVEVYPKKADFKNGSNTYHLWTWDEIKVPNLIEIYQYN